MSFGRKYWGSDAAAGAGRICGHDDGSSGSALAALANPEKNIETTGRDKAKRMVVVLRERKITKLCCQS